MTTIILKSLDINQPNWLGEIKSDEEFVFSLGVIYLKVKLRDDLVPENNTGEMEALFIEIIKERYYSRYDISTTNQQIKRI